MGTEEEYKKHPIYGTDLNKSASELLCDISSKLQHIRGQVYDVGCGFPVVKEQLVSAEGALTCLIGYIHDLKDKAIANEVAQLTRERGKHLDFKSRGLGKELSSHCFVCGFKDSISMMDNVAAFVRTKAEGEEIASWFNKGGRRLDYREQEPNWLQVKVWACKKHVPNLKYLINHSSKYGVLCKMDVEDIRAFHIDRVTKSGQLITDSG